MMLTLNVPLRCLKACISDLLVGTFDLTEFVAMLERIR